MIEPLIEGASPLHETSGKEVSKPAMRKEDSVELRPSQTVRTGTEWVKDFAGDFDFCIVLPAEKGLPTKKGEGYIRKLRALGFELFIYKNLRENDEILILIRTPLEKLRAFADNINMVLLLDPKEIEDQLKAGVEAHGIGSTYIPHVPEVTHYQPYQYIYGQYSRQIDERLYWKEDGVATPFRELIRLKLCQMILESRPSDGSENLKIARYLRSGWMKGVFPLHNRAKTELIDYKMKFYPKSPVPLDDLKEYFGEKIALYFAFTEHFTFWLLAPAIVGIPFQIAVFAINDYSAPFLPFFSVFISIWAVFMLEFWKRKEKTIALKWGTINFEETEVDRPDFKGKEIVSFIDGSKIRYFPSKTRNFYVVQSVVGIVSLILLVVGVVVSIYILRYAITNDVGDGNAQTIASVANAIQIQILNYIYSIVAKALSDRENHRTNTEYEDSMITKIFLFQFVNSYASFFYLAFIAGHLEGGCPSGDCMFELAINLAIIFGSRLITGNLMELLIPYLSYQWKYRTEVLIHGDDITRPEKELLLEPYDPMASNLEDYSEVAITFGYMALFVTALPMSAAFACLSSFVEVKGDSWKLLNLHQRPFPKGAEDIGTWQTIFLTIAVIAVITNAGLTVFTMNLIESYSKDFQYWVFILFQWVIFLLQGLIMAVIPDVPEEIDIQLKRTEFICRKLIDKVADDIDEDVTGEAEELVFKQYPKEGGNFTKNTHAFTQNMK